MPASQPLGNLVAQTPQTTLSSRITSAASTGDLSGLQAVITSTPPPDPETLLEAAISAAQSNQPSTLAYLLDHGVAPDPTIATLSVSKASPEIFQTLYDHGWRPEQNDPVNPGRAGEMPILLRALTPPNTPLIHWLLPHTTTNPTSGPHTALSITAGTASLTLLSLLLSHGFALKNSNALHAAARSPKPNSPEIMQTFLSHGIDINALEVFHGVSGRSPKERGTALQAAIQANRIENIKWLLEHGADGNVKSESGLTAVDWAMQCGSSEEVLEILRASGCH